LKKSKWNILSYRLAVMTYRNARGKKEKREMERLIESIKSDFETEVAANDKRLIQLKKLNGDLFTHTNQTSLFERSKKEVAEWNKKVSDLACKIKKLETELEEVKNNKIYENAFEWRFEFPEVLNDEGEFVGFDLVIGNPPYIPSSSLDEQTKNYIYQNYRTAEYQINTYGVFIEKSLNILRNQSFFGLIVPNYWLSTKYDTNLRRILFNENHTVSLLNTYQIFEDATVDTLVIIGFKDNIPIFPKKSNIISISNEYSNCTHRLAALSKELWAFHSFLEIANLEQNVEISFQKKIHLFGKYVLGDFVHCYKGMQPYEEGKGDPPQTREMMNEKIYHSDIKIDDSYFPLIGSGNVQHYFLRKPKNFIKYGKNLAAPRKFEIFNGPRLLANRILSKKNIDIVYIVDLLINNTDVFNLLPKTEHYDKLLSLLAILGSNTCATYFKSSNINLDRKAFPKLNVNNLETFPIPEISDEIKEILENKVTEILDAKKSDITVDTTLQEKEIDQMVYSLYGLTEEEIQVIEGDKIEL